MVSLEVKALVKQKDDIESELRELQEVLKSHKSNMTDNLVDSQGYPRSDIDVITIRKTRHRIICLQNDLKKLMVDIEDGIHRLHAEARDQKSLNSELAANEQEMKSQHTNLQPFLRVNQVDEGSPAEKAGLQVNDLITKFGSVAVSNFDGLKSIGSIVAHSKGEEIIVSVRRDAVDKKVTLIPNNWNGKGLLGCNIIPIKR